MLVRECLRQAPVTVPPECTIAEAGALMRTHNVGSLIVDRGGMIVGVVTDRDLAIRGCGDRRPLETPVGEVMTENPTTIQGSEDLFVAFTRLRDAAVRRLPVLEEDEIAGIVTMDDLLVWLALEFSAVLSPVAEEVLHKTAP
jgi:CBS domain-containing protein